MSLWQSRQSDADDRRLVYFIIGSMIVAAMLLHGQMPASNETHLTQVTAKKYEFDPSTITVKKGDRVKLAITAVDHDHGIKLEAFKIDQLLKKGTTTTIEFTADKAGTFPFQCSHFCGLGHSKMKGQLVVRE